MCYNILLLFKHSRDYMRRMKIPDGLLELGYAKEDIPDLVKGAIPQVNKLHCISKAMVTQNALC